MFECICVNECVICIESTGIPLDRCRVFSFVRSSVRSLRLFIVCYATPLLICMWCITRILTLLEFIWTWFIWSPQFFSSSDTGVVLSFVYIYACLLYVLCRLLVALTMTLTACCGSIATLLHWVPSRSVSRFSHLFRSFYSRSRSFIWCMMSLYF